MDVRIQYVGPASTRVISEADMRAMGVENHQGFTIAHKGFAEVPEEIVARLVLGGGFRVIGMNRLRDASGAFITKLESEEIGKKAIREQAEQVRAEKAKPEKVKAEQESVGAIEEMVKADKAEKAKAEKDKVEEAEDDEDVFIEKQRAKRAAAKVDGA